LLALGALPSLPALATTIRVTTPPIEVDTTLADVGREVATGDFNGDGNVDLVFYTRERPQAGTPGGITVHQGDGNGGFILTHLFEFDAGQGLGTGDFDGDGNLDIIVKRRAVLGFNLWRGLGDGSFQIPRITTVITAYDPLPDEPSVEYADLNGDGARDIAVWAQDQGQKGVAILLADGTGGFTATSLAPTVGTPKGIVAADFDGDGDLDLAASQLVTGGSSRLEVSTFLGDGAGFFTPSQSWNAGSRVLLPSIVAHDRDDDGDVDIFFDCGIQYQTGDPNNPISTGKAYGSLEGSGNGFFLDPEFHLDFIDHSFMVAADVDGDGLGDVVCLTATSLTVLRGSRMTTTGYEGATGVGLGLGLPTCLSYQLTKNHIAVDDVDGDGERDFITGNNCTTSGRINLNRTRFFGSRVGVVNARVGPVIDVLFVNGSAGSPVEREVMVNQGDPLLIRMEAPPSAMGGMASFALYGWARAPVPGDTVALPFRLGDACRAMPLVNPVPSRSPRKIWNNIGFDQVLGTADLPSTAAPSDVLNIASISVTGEFTLQGLILDTNAPRRGIATTNAVIVKIQQVN
jgi:hypothetical protein